MKIERKDTKPAILTLGDLRPGMCFEMEECGNRVFIRTNNDSLDYHKGYLDLETGKFIYGGGDLKVHPLNAKVVVEDQK